MFATVDHEEVQRLNALCVGIKTFDDAISRFGEPDFDQAAGLVTTTSIVGGAEEHRPHRVISYKDLSDVANVRFTHRLGDLVAISFMGKYVGPPIPTDDPSQG